MGNLQIKDMAPELHEKLKARAAEAGMTQRDYVLKLIEEDLAVPSNEEWFRRLREMPPTPGLDSAALIRQGREERIAELDARLDERWGVTPDRDAPRRR